MATWGDQTCQRFEATAVGFETGFSRLRVRPSNRYAIAPHDDAFISNIANVKCIYIFPSPVYVDRSLPMHTGPRTEHWAYIFV